MRYRPPRSKYPQKPREPMTEDDCACVIMLNRCRKKLESEHKLFVYQISRRAETHPERGITPPQRWWLWDLFWKYRRTISERCGRSQYDFDEYQRLREVARIMHDASRLRWTVRNLRRDAAYKSIADNSEQLYCDAAESKFPE